MSTTPTVYDVDADRFEQDVVERSHELPVVVDFWAAWCGPCRTLGPILEQAVAARGGEVALAKVDVDRNQALAARFGIRGIPAVKAFVDGAVADEFVGALGRPQVEAFLDRVVPSAADCAVTVARARLEGGDDEGAREAFERALEDDPDHRDAAVGLAGLLVESDPDRAADLVGPHLPHPDAEVVAHRLKLRQGAGDVAALRERVHADPDDASARLDLGRALAAAGEYDAALDELLTVVRLGGDERESARQEIVSLLRVLGDDDPRVPDARRRLANALF